MSLLIVVGLIATVVPGVVARAHGDDQGVTVTRQYLAGAGFLCSLSSSACPDVAKAANGDTLSIGGTGTFSVENEEATGGGTFVHMNSDGQVLASGTWTATEFVSFVSYGTDGGTFPANFEGGRVVLTVHLTPATGGDGFDGVLQITCLIGNPPLGAEEGITLAIQDGPNFSQTVSGFTLFMLPS